MSRRLLSWFRRHARDLPWRRSRDPYPIWISEIMLQQTQVATVIPYFERFLHAFPSVDALARAEEAEVLRLWEGLGYYRRARNLHLAAQVLVASHDSVFPPDADAAKGLPGIGRYTANAILSQAFDQRLPILESNSVRLLSRLFGRREDPRRGPGQAWLWQAAERLLPDRHAGDFNQAVMELGALICTPEDPDCGSCPLADVCEAHRLGLQASIPVRAVKPATIEIEEVAIVPTRRGQVLLVQRPASGRWANLWEFPHGPVHAGESNQSAAQRLLAELTGLEGHIGNQPPFLSLRYSVTHHRYAMTCLRAHVARGRFRAGAYEQGRWLDADQLADFPVSAPQRRLARALIAMKT
ncbi:MAG: A/G-specific adenine glycosylase [Gemmataceae bacterium]